MQCVKLNFIIISYLMVILLIGISVHAVPLRYIPKLQQEIVIDGKLEEECYKNTQPVERFTVAGHPEQEAPTTQAWVFWNEEKMVFTFNCADENIAAKPRSWDEMAVAPQDRVEFYLWSGNEEDQFISFEIAPLGASLEYRTKYYRFFNFGWTPETLNFAVSLTDEGYCMEAELFAEDLAQAKIPLDGGARFRAGLFRSQVEDLAKNEEPTWITWIDASEPFPDFHIPRSVGVFVLEDADHPGSTLGNFGYWEIDDQQVKLRPKGTGDPMLVQINERVKNWQLIWTGLYHGDKWGLLESESGFALISDECRIVRLEKPAQEIDPADPERWYDGKSAEEILASPQDILGNKILEKENIDANDIAALLPPLSNGYQILGSPLSGGISPIVLSNGKIQFGNTVLYDPSEVEVRLKNQKPLRGLLDNWMPIAHYYYFDSKPAYRMIAFVPVWERGNIPAVYVGLSEIDADGFPQKMRCWKTNASSLEPIEEKNFWLDFVQTVFHWKQFERSLSLPEIPDQKILQAVKGGLALTRVIFAGEHPHYGARNYGETVHDTFPPAFLNALETAFRYGEHEWAKSLIAFWFRYCVNQDGTIRYWQRDVCHAASASEYGMMYRLLAKIDRAKNQSWGIQSYLDQLEESTHYLHSLRRSIDSEGVRLIHMGAEADNAELKNAYFSNNLWTAEGLEQLANLFERYQRKGTAAQLHHMAQDIMSDIQKALTSTAIQTEYGLLPPIHPFYAALPLTLSAGVKRPEEISKPLWNDYINNKMVTIPAGNLQQPPQNLRENTYANYRYYLEMLSSGALPHEMAEAIVRMRAARGGELLGMTRFSGHLDDWPVAEWAKYLLSTDRLKEYWLLFYSHILHHQDREMLTAFEQAGIDGRYRAADCIPSQLVAARMLVYAFAFEFPGDDHLYLLRGIPEDWYEAGKRFDWLNAPTTSGEISLEIACNKRHIEIKIDLSSILLDVNPVIQLNFPFQSNNLSIRDGWDLIGKIERNRIYLQEGKKGNLYIVIKR